MNTTLSRKILIGHMVMFLLALLGIAGTFMNHVVLVPSLVIPGLELWRLVSYVLGVQILSLLIGAICFSAPGEEMEQMLGERSFGIHLAVIVVLAGLLHMAMFYGSKTAMAGTTNPALFMLVGFVYLFPHSEIRLLFFSIRSWVVLAFTAAVVVFATGFTVAGGGSPFLLLSNGGFGLLAGAAYFHVRYQKYALLLRPIRAVEALFEPDEPAARSARGRVAATSVPRIRIAFPKGGAAAESRSDEERLDEILDRINEKGYDSLSEDDRLFLEEYSSR